MFWKLIKTLIGYPNNIDCNLLFANQEIFYFILTLNKIYVIIWSIKFS